MVRFSNQIIYCCLDDKSSNLGKAFDDLKNQWPDILEEFKPVPENECNEPTQPTVATQPTVSTQPGHGMYIACQHIKYESRHS
jgi:hypothetical protein